MTAAQPIMTNSLKVQPELSNLYNSIYAKEDRKLSKVAAQFVITIFLEDHVLEMGCAGSSDARITVKSDS